jgi:hypothetical protein
MLSCIVLLAIGFAAGTYYGWTHLGKFSRSVQTLFSMAGYSQYVFLEYQNASYSQAKKALLEYIDLIDDLKKERGADQHYRMLQTDAMMSYARIAFLEEKNGNLSEYEKYMQKAIKRCEALGWKDCSPDKIRQFVERIENKWRDPKTTSNR